MVFKRNIWEKKMVLVHGVSKNHGATKYLTLPKCLVFEELSPIT